MVSSQIRVGIIGCGGIAYAHVNGLRLLKEAGLDDFRITALCSRNPDNMRRLNDRSDAIEQLPPIVPEKVDPLNIRDIYVTDVQGAPAAMYTDWRDLVASADVDAVIILTTVDVHHVIALAALGEGKHVIIEKPFTITVRAARKVVEMAIEKNVTVAVAESLRYRKATRTARWAMDAGYIGALDMVVHAGIGSVWSPDRIVGKTAWRHRKLETGAGILMDIGAHLFDKVRYLCGEPDTVTGLVRTIEPLRTTRDAQGDVVEKVACNVEDTAFSTMTFKNGAIGSFALSWAGHGAPTALPGGMVLYGDLGCIREDKIISEHAGSRSIDDQYEAGVTAEQRAAWFPRGIEDPFALELHDFFAAIRDGRQPETSGLEGLRDIAVGYAIIESSLRGEAVSFREVEECRIENYQRPINDHIGIRS